MSTTWQCLMHVGLLEQTQLSNCMAWKVCDLSRSTEYGVTCDFCCVISMYTVSSSLN